MAPGDDEAMVGALLSMLNDRELAARLGSRLVSSVVFHGDFAPWNIKVDRAGAWMVLDWERGELHGVPCWD